MIFFGANYLITSLLQYRDFVTKQDLYNYCLEIKKALSEDPRFGNVYLYFETCDQYVKCSISPYKDNFFEFGKGYESFRRMRLGYFQINPNQEDISKEDRKDFELLLEKVAKKMSEKIPIDQDRF